jgi:TPR repeat protein
MYNLGILYDNGLGVAQDYGKAREWYQKAVDAGNTNAMYNLGWLYQEGLARKTHKKNSKAASVYCKFLLLNKLNLTKRTPLQ